MNVGEIVKKCRATRGVTQRQLSEKSGVARQTIADAEQNRRGTSVYVFTQLLKAMDYDLAVIDRRK